MAGETTTITLKDKDGNAIYTKTGLTDSATSVITSDANNYPLQLPLSGDTTLAATIVGGNAPAGATFGVVLLIESY